MCFIWRWRTTFNTVIESVNLMKRKKEKNSYERHQVANLSRFLSGNFSLIFNWETINSEREFFTFRLEKSHNANTKFFRERNWLIAWSLRTINDQRFATLLRNHTKNQQILCLRWHDIQVQPFSVYVNRIRSKLKHYEWNAEKNNKKIFRRKNRKRSKTISSTKKCSLWICLLNVESQRRR